MTPTENVQEHTAIPEDVMEADPVKQGDQIALLVAVAHLNDTGEWKPLFTYPNCGWHLVQSGFCTPEKEITMAGRAALFLLGKGRDPTEGGSSLAFSLPLPLASAPTQGETP